MCARNIGSEDRRSDEPLLDYSQSYLRDYWPEFPGDAPAWADNAVLMLAYQDAAIAVSDYFNGRPVRLLDVSTGPALAPLLAMINCVSDAQLSDFHQVNRTALRQMPIEYWRNYVPMLIRHFDHPNTMTDEILSRLDRLRRSHPPLAVDLFSDSPFGSEVSPHDYELVSMNFVADSITRNEKEYLQCLGRVTDMVRPGAAFSMSAVVDSGGWKRGIVMEPAPNIAEKTIVDFLTSQGFEMLHLSRSMRLRGLTYEGGWIVLAAYKKAR